MYDSAQQDGKVSRIRVLVICILIGVLAFVYIGRLFSMQVIQSTVYETRADELARRSQIIPAKRGEIYDRNYDIPIASNYDTFALFLNPETTDATQIRTVVEKLESVLNTNKGSLIRKLPQSMRLYQPVELISGIKYEDIVFISEHKEEFPGISWENKPIRTYSQGRSMAHILGYVGEITPEELQVMYNRGYTAKSSIGKNGIEGTYNDILHGTDGIRFRRVDASGRRVGGADVTEVPPVLGKNIVLTIDRRIQVLAERSLGDRIGSIIVLKPNTGEILAMVSYPSYDPNLFYTEQSSSAFSLLSQDTRSPFLNRAIQAAASPASTFKILMGAAVLEERAFPKNSTIFCSGSLLIGNRVFSCHLLTGHGRVDFFDAIAQSCNVYFYTIGNEYLGVNKIVDYSYRFGLGEITGVDLPGEVAGLVPTPEWKQQTFGTQWVGGDTVNMSIGQGFLATTPLQLADMVAGIANGGAIYQPHLLKEVRDSETYEILETNTPKLMRRLDLREDTIKDLQDAMRGVVTNGTPAQVMTTKSVVIAAKTGTAETGREDVKHSWFAAYAPYNATDPDDVVAVIVWVDAVNEWEWWAPKAANILFHGIFTKQSYEDTVKDLQPLWYLQSPEQPPGTESTDGLT